MNDINNGGINTTLRFIKRTYEKSTEVTVIISLIIATTMKLIIMVVVVNEL